MATLTAGNLRICEKLRTRYSQGGSVVTGAGVHGDEGIDRRALEDAVVDAGSGRGMCGGGLKGTMIGRQTDRQS